MLFILKSCRLLLVIIIPILGTSQNVKPNTFGNVYIPSGGFMTIFGQHNFMEGSGFIKPGIVTTARIPSPGTINYSNKSGWSGASEAQYVDGYVKSFYKGAFTFPIGQNGYYRPICLSKAYSSYAAYYRENPTHISSYNSTDIDKISEKEYWSIHLHAESKLTLTWAKGSDVDDIISTNKLESMTIVGLNKRSNQWEMIPSKIDEYTLNVSVHGATFNTNTKSKASLGSISTNDEVAIDTYSAFTIASLAPHVLYKQPQISVYPNPQLVGHDITIDYNMSDDKGGLVKVYKADNSFLFAFDLVDEAGTIKLPYPISESGSYIIGITDSRGKTSFQNLILVDK